VGADNRVPRGAGRICVEEIWAGGLVGPGWEQAKQKLAQENTIDIALLIVGEV